MTNNDISEGERHAPQEDLAQSRVALPTVMDERPRGAITVDVYRDEARVLTKIKTIAAAAGDDFYYRWPTKNKDGSTGWVEGPSIGCANAVARLYGNNSVRVRSADMGSHWIFTAQFYDFETGYVLERQFQQRKNQKTMKTDPDRQLDIIFQIGQSKAIRNVVANALSTFTDYAFFEAKNSLVEKIGKNPKPYLDRIAQRLKEMDVTADRVERVLGRTFDKWLAPEIARVGAELQAIQDGMALPDDMWPRLDTPENRPQPENYGKEGQPKEEGKTAEVHNGDDAPGRTEGGKKEEPKAAEAKSDPKEEPKVEVDEVRAFVASKVLAAKNTNGIATLERIDDIVCEYLAQNKREDLRAEWNPVYDAEKKRIEPPKETEKPKAQADQKPAKNTQREDEFKDWLADQYKSVADCTTNLALDALEDKVVAELKGDPKAIGEFKARCAERAKELSAGKRRR